MTPAVVFRFETKKAGEGVSVCAGGWGGETPSEGSRAAGGGENGPRRSDGII